MELVAYQPDIFIQLILAVILGASLGIERSLAGKTAGMRTYTLVTLGSTLFVLISQIVSDSYIAAGIRVFDPLRVSSQIIVGIGFLGAGLIVFQENKLRGLTTAAGLWVACGIGMALGFKLYALAVLVAIITLFVFTVLWYLECMLGARPNVVARVEEKQS